MSNLRAYRRHVTMQPVYPPARAKRTPEEIRGAALAADLVQAGRERRFDDLPDLLAAVDDMTKAMGLLAIVAYTATIIDAFAELKGQAPESLVQILRAG